jgi:hypothetical protein
MGAIHAESGLIHYADVRVEEMDLVLDPLAQRLITNPASPDRVGLMAVGVRLHGPPPSA